MSYGEGKKESFAHFREQLSLIRNGEGSSKSKDQIKLIDRNLQNIEATFIPAQRWVTEVTDQFEEMTRKVARSGKDDKLIAEISDKIYEINMQVPRITGLLSSSATSLKGYGEKKKAEEEISEITTKWQKTNVDSWEMDVLRKRYDGLEEQLKSCFLCLSIFPENSIIKKRALIYWWIGEELVPTSTDGEEYFKKLIKSGLIVPVYEKRRRIAKSCKLEPPIRWMAITLAKEGGFFDFDSNGKPTKSHKRECLTTAKANAEVRVILNSNSGKLKTLFNVNAQYLQFDKEFFSRRNANMKVLRLGRWQSSVKHHIEVINPSSLDGLGLLKSLTYLDLQGISMIRELPKSIGKLSNLKVLNLRACHNLERLGAEITSLKKLTHLDVSDCYLIDYMPKGLGSLSELQVLKGFVVGSTTERSKHSCTTLDDLASLSGLRKLSIRIGSDPSIRGKVLEIKNRYLRILTITFGRGLNSPMIRYYPRCIEKLDLRCVPEIGPPTVWFRTPWSVPLKRLYITGGCWSESDTQWFRGFEEVEILRLKYLNNIALEWSHIREVFNDLRYMEMVGCPLVESYNGDRDGVWVKEEEEASTSNQKAKTVQRG